MYLVGAGTLNQAPCHARQVFGFGISANAAKLVLVHNHPSGDPSPSHNDIRLTEGLVKAGGVIGIPVVDHVVVGAGGSFVSLRERGYC